MATRRLQVRGTAGVGSRSFGAALLLCGSDPRRAASGGAPPEAFATGGAGATQRACCQRPRGAAKPVGTLWNNCDTLLAGCLRQWGLLAVQIARSNEVDPGAAPPMLQAALGLAVASFNALLDDEISRLDRFVGVQAGPSRHLASCVRTCWHSASADPAGTARQGELLHQRRHHFRYGCRLHCHRAD